ncbi:MAG: hypothetical protein AAFO69_19975, partial [Bacteroidota bacterium]
MTVHRIFPKTWFSSFLISFIILFAACQPEDNRPSLDAKNKDFNFLLSVKNEDLQYSKNTGYPEHVTFILNIEPSASEDLVQ